MKVIPVIGLLSDKDAFKPVPNPAEVESVFDAPLEMFIKVTLFDLQVFLHYTSFIVPSYFDIIKLQC